MKWLVLLAATLAGCVTRAPIPTVILTAPLPPDKYAQTFCSLNNQPYVVADTGILTIAEFEGIVIHEETHVAQARAFRGGCWPFVYRYQADAAFRRRVEFEAYCAEGRWLIARNRRPDVVWNRIRDMMEKLYGAASLPNCLYEEPTSQEQT